MPPPPENSKELSKPEPPADPGECGPPATQIAAAAADTKAEPAPPIADGLPLPLILFTIFGLIFIFLIN